MRNTYEIKKKYCIEFEEFANDLWIDDKHSNYWYWCAKYDKDNKIDVWEETYLVTMVDYQMNTFKEWNWEILDKEVPKWQN